jgi:hypothetical protein
MNDGLPAYFSSGKNALEANWWPDEIGRSWPLLPPLQRRLVHVQVHAVDSLDLQRHVPPEEGL